jgi:pimeloyl-ACP methyl ester carboxylesterase
LNRKTKKILVLLTGVLIATSIALSGFSYYIFMQFTSKRFKNQASHEKAAAQKQQLIEEHNALPVTLKTEDGLNLSGLFIKRPQAKRALLFCHGWWMNKEKMRHVVEFFPHDSLLLFDFRAHGESDGYRTSIGHNEQQDIQAAYAFLKHECPDLPLYGIGISMGAATLLAVAQTLPFAGLVIDSVFKKLDDAIEGRFTHYTGLPKFPFMPLCKKIYHVLIGAAMHEVNTSEWIKNINTPILFLHSKEDLLAPESIAHELHELSLHEKKRLWIVDKSPHAAIHKHHAHEYQAKVNEFFVDLES